MILITGGTGYIGAHTCIELLNSHEDVLLIDNLINSKKETLNRIQKICQKSVKFFEGDIRDNAFLKKIFNNFPIDSVIHFAGLKSVEESFQKPDLYHENNVMGTLNLIEVMGESHCKKLIFLLLQLFMVTLGFCQLLKNILFLRLIHTDKRS